jgi:hypothetical protein
LRILKLRILKVLMLSPLALWERSINTTPLALWERGRG